MIKRTNNDISKNNFTTIKNCHIILCCSKVITSEWLIKGMNTIITSMGGHGYSSYNEVANKIKGSISFRIYEGENSMLMLLVGKFLLK